MGPKKQKSKVQFKEPAKAKQGATLEEGVSQPEIEAQFEESADAKQDKTLDEVSESAQATVTSSESSKKRYGGARGVSAMYKIVVKKAQGKKEKVRCNELGVPIGQTRHALQFYIGMLARTMIPIDITNWPSVDPDLKEKLWIDIQDTFKVPNEVRSGVLKSACAKWRQFKSSLTIDYVKPNLGQKKKLKKPPNKYKFVGKEAWKRFVAQRTTDAWQSLSEKQSSRVSNRKYPHRTSRKGYIGLVEEEQKSGNLEPGEIPDRAILWKKARKPKDEKTMIDGELAKIKEKIMSIDNEMDTLLEQQRKGEFKPCGSEDVLSKALETPEHAGRVRGIGSWVTPSVYFNLPKGKRYRITKAELMERDRQRDAEFEKAKHEMSAEIEKTKHEMAELKAMIKSNNLSPMISDKASFHSKQVHETKSSKPSVAKDLEPMMDDDIQCIAAIDLVPQDTKGPKKCELAVDNIENKVAFGLMFDEEEMNQSVHGVTLQPGCVRVSVDGSIQGDALVPIPVPGEIETVNQAVGSHISWPRKWIIFSNDQTDTKRRKEKEPKNDLQKLQSAYKNVKINNNVPARFRLLYKHATTYMKSNGASIQMPCDADVFGIEKRMYILHESITELLEFKMIGQAAISAYIMYLHNVVVKEDKNLDLYAFCDPGATFTANQEFQDNIVRRLKEGNPDRMFMMPHNCGFHWILIIIYADEILFLNPLPRSTSFPNLEIAISRAIKSYNAEVGRGIKTPNFKYLVGCPKQPGGMECGYVVMRYMKEIVKDTQMKFLRHWMNKTRNNYTRAELDEVRFEALAHIESFM